MKLFFNLIVILFCLNCFSQEDSISFYNQKGKFEKAIIYGEKAKNDKSITKKNRGILLDHLAFSYTQIGDIKNAEINYLEELEIIKSLFGDTNSATANIYRKLANIYCSDKQLKKTTEYYEKALITVELTIGTNSFKYSEYLLDFAISQKIFGDIENAEKNYLKACDILLKLDGENSNTYQNALISVAVFYSEQKNYREAENFLLKSYHLQKLNYTIQTFPSFNFTLDIIALHYSNLQKYDSSELFYLESLDLKKNYLGEYHVSVIQTFINLGVLYSWWNKKEQSKLNFEKAQQSLLLLGKENSLENAFVLKALATIFQYESNLTRAELNLKKVIEIYNFLNIKDENYFEAKINLAYNYLNMGHYGLSEKIYFELLNEITDKKSEDYFKVLCKLIDFYYDFGNSKKANLLIDELTKTFLQLKHSDQIDVEFTYFRSLQMYFESIDQPEEALKFALKRKESLEKSPFFESLALAYDTVLSDIGSCYKKLGDVKSWKEYKFKAYNIWKDDTAKKTRNYASLLLDIGNIYNNDKNSSEALKFYIESISILESKNLEGTKLYEEALLYLSTMYINSKNKKVYPIFNKLLLKNKLDTEKYVSFLTTDELQNVKHNTERSKVIIYSDFHNNPNKHSILNIAAYENELLLKNLSLRNQQRIKNTIEKSDDNSLKEKYKKFTANKHYLTKLEEMPSSEFPVNYDQLKADTETLDKEITRLSSAFTESKKALSVDFKQIQQKLKPNEVIVDIVSFNYYNKKWTDSIMYGVFVIKKESKYPKYISLFEQKQLKSLLENNSNNSDSTRINKQYSSKAISDLFLKPLETELKNGKTIYIVPSGLAHQINFKALPLNEKQTLGEQFNVVLMGASSSIMDYKTTVFQNNNELEFILYGGIDYNKIGTETNDEAAENNFNELATRSGILTYNYLPGTNTEIKKINEEVQKHDFKSVLKTDKQATEESIKQLDGKQNPYVLHIATHGFFFEDLKRPPTEEGRIINDYTKQNTYSESDDPMMRSGLILAGANKYWGKTNEKLGSEDGILTAKEIANLDLSNCQLVVLSACETGLGQINGSEGVFGLQRAFKMAGVKNIIMSLWKVPDAQTSELFTIFYAECFKGQTIQQAFQTAQSQMKAKYAPYYWAGFVLLE